MGVLFLHGCTGTLWSGDLDRNWTTFEAIREFRKGAEIKPTRHCGQRSRLHLSKLAAERGKQQHDCSVHVDIQPGHMHTYMGRIPRHAQTFEKRGCSRSSAGSKNLKVSQTHCLLQISVAAQKDKDRWREREHRTAGWEPGQRGGQQKNRWFDCYVWKKVSAWWAQRCVPTFRCSDTFFLCAEQITTWFSLGANEPADALHSFYFTLKEIRRMGTRKLPWVRWRELGDSRCSQQFVLNDVSIRDKLEAITSLRHAYYQVFLHISGAPHQCSLTCWTWTLSREAL